MLTAYVVVPGDEKVAVNKGFRLLANYIFGNNWDNAASESFFHTLKTELVYHITFKTTGEAKQAIFEYIEVFYNQVRMHSANDYLSPVEYEQAHNFN